MGANAQTSVPLYAANEVLTAANMNISAGTGVPVFATTVTRDAAFGGANEKGLAEGQLCYIEASDVVQYYDGAAWATVGPSQSTGIVAIASATSNLTFDSTETLAITASTFTAVTGRYYKVTYFEPQLPQVQNSNIVQQRIRLTNTSGTQLSSTIYKNTTAVSAATNSATLVYAATFTAGSTVIIGSLQSPGASVSATRSATMPAQILVEDIGVL